MHMADFMQHDGADFQVITSEFDKFIGENDRAVRQRKRIGL